MNNTAPTKNKTSKAPSVAIQTLGCKLNQSESDSIATQLQHMGYRVIERPRNGTAGDVKYMIINTCTVTAKADRKSRHSIYQALRRSPALQEELDTEHAQRTRPIVIVTGCFVGNGQSTLDTLPIDYVVDNSKKSYIPEIIDAHEKNQILNYSALKPDYFNYTPPGRIFHTRTNLKIQDGCDNFCSFCIIPLVRGTARSLPLNTVLQNAAAVIAGGCREMVLTGVNMSRYSDNSGSKTLNFSDLIEALLQLPNSDMCRFHISSLEPDKLDDKFFDLLQHPRLCSHLHLCLQSGSDRILLKMRRMYSIAEYMDCVERIKKRNAHYNFTTDIIVGFPEENDEDFSQSMKIIKDVGFSHIHAFPYSARKGTRAERLQMLDPATMKQRMEMVQDLCRIQKKQYRLSMLQKEQTVLVERSIEGKDYRQSYGLSNYYIPIEIQSSKKAATEHSTSNPPIGQNSLVPVHPHSWKEEEDPILLAEFPAKSSTFPAKSSTGV